MTSSLISIFIFAIMPMILVLFTAMKKDDNTNVIKIPKWFRGITILFSNLSITIICLFYIPSIRPSSFQAPNDISFLIIWLIIFVFPSVISLFWSFTYKITINDNYFVYRTIFIKKMTFRYEEITGIKWFKGNNSIRTFKILIGKKKIEVTNWMVNYDLIYKKLSKEKIFKKYPQLQKK